MSKFCGNCGTKVVDSAVFCPECGYHFKSKPAAAPKPAPAKPAPVNCSPNTGKPTGKSKPVKGNRPAAKPAQPKPSKSKSKSKGKKTGIIIASVLAVLLIAAIAVYFILGFKANKPPEGITVSSETSVSSSDESSEPDTNDSTDATESTAALQ